MWVIVRESGKYVPEGEGCGAGKEAIERASTSGRQLGTVHFLADPAPVPDHASQGFAPTRTHKRPQTCIKHYIEISGVYMYGK